MPVTTFKTVAGRVLAQNKGGVYTRLVHDPLGNVIATCDAAGVVSNNTTYWPYGEVRTGGVSSVTPFGFCGAWGYYTDATGRLYVRARYYRSSLTRWQTVDPLWPNESAYAYADTQPVSDLDFRGLKPGKGKPGKGKTPKITNLPKDCTPPWWDNVITGCFPVSNAVCLACAFPIGDAIKKAWPKDPDDNAMRHCIGACTMQRQCGCRCAYVLDAKEGRGWLRTGGKQIEDHACDILNNRIGRALGEKYPSENCVNLCSQADKQGLLCDVRSF